MSLASPSGTAAITCSVCGQTTSIRLDECGEHHCPSINILSNSLVIGTPPRSLRRRRCQGMRRMDRPSDIRSASCSLLLRTGLSQAATRPAPKRDDYPDLPTTTTHGAVLSHGDEPLLP